MSDVREFQTVIKTVGSLTKEEYDYVLKVANDDGHASFGITHVVERDKQPIGHISICGLPVVSLWMHTKNSNIRDAIRVMDFYENVVRCSGMSKPLIVPCRPESPFRAIMEKVGYIKGHDSTLFFKNL